MGGRRVVSTAERLKLIGAFSPVAERIFHHLHSQSEVIAKFRCPIVQLLQRAVYAK